MSRIVRCSPIVWAFAAVVFAATQVSVEGSEKPIDLLRDAARAAATPESVSVDFSVTTVLVRNDQQSETRGDFRYRTAADDRFEFVTVGEGGAAPRAGYRVAGNSDVTMTQLISQRRHMLVPTRDGITPFVRSPAAEGIGNGLGGLALALLHPVAVEDVVANVSDSEYVGEEELDGEPVHHARYTVDGEMRIDMWFSAEGAPVIRAIEPYVLNTPGVRQMAQRYEKFDFRIRFRFENWDTSAGFAGTDIRVEEPSNSLLMASLFQPPAPEPHVLLGQEAPEFELPTPEGDRVSLSAPEGNGATLVEFWSTSCVACLQAMPELDRLQERFADRGLRYLAVNIGEPADTVATFLERRGLNPTALIDEGGAVTNAYRVGPIPLILVVGSDGRVQVAQEGIGPGFPEDLATKIDATLRGEDVASDQLDAQRRRERERVAERKRLRSLLDG